jgi:hypothetical protein
MSSSVIYNKADKDQLYYDLHSVTVQFVPSATPRMVKTTVTSLASGSYDCSALALKLYWILSNHYFTMSPAKQYLERLKENADTVETVTGKVVESSLRDYWREEG